MIDWKEYERQKALLREKNYTSDEYERKIQEILKELENDNTK